MAETGISININSREYQERLKQFREYKLNKMLGALRDSSEPLVKSRIWMYKDILEHFEKETGPEGKWQPLKPSTIKRRRKGSARILQDTGRLRMSISGYSDNKRAVVGTNLMYARMHQEGKGRVPARPYLWISDNIQDRIFKQFKLYISEGK